MHVVRPGWRAVFPILLVLATLTACHWAIQESRGPGGVRFAAGVGPGLGNDAVILVARIPLNEHRTMDDVLAVSADGRTWRAPDYVEPPPDTNPPRTGDECVPFAQNCPGYDVATIRAAKTAHPVVCTGELCLRVVPGHLAIEESTDGGTSWRPAWEVGETKQARYAMVLANEARWGGFSGDIRAGMTCDSLYVVPGSGVVVAACGLVGFVTRDPGGTWTMIGFEGREWSLEFLDLPSPSDELNQLMIVLCGWLILVLGAEVHALRHRRGRRPVVRWVLAGLVTLIMLPVLLADRSSIESVTSAWVAAPVLFVGVAAWLGLYLRDRRAFPWWLLPLTAVAPAAGWILHDRLLQGEFDRTAGWGIVWTVLAGALVTNLALGLLPRGRTPTA